MTFLLQVIIATVFLTAATLSPSLTYSQQGRPCGRCYCKIKRHQLVADCNARNFSSIPNIPNSSLIDVLLLDSNDLHNLTVGSFSQFPNILSLSLADNVIGSIDVGAFQNLHKLQILNLTGNRLKYFNSVFKRGIFKYLNRLEILSLIRNADSNYRNQTYPEFALSDVTSLKRLYLDGLTNQTFGKGFSNMTSLRVLSFRDGYCNIQNLFNETFIHVKQISNLSLTKCSIKHIEAGTFLPFKYSLTNLDLSYNRDLGFHGVGKAAFGWQNSRLQILNISSIVPEYAICVKVTINDLKYFRNTSIEEMYVDGNRIEAFEHGALQLFPPTLTKVHVKRSRFTIGNYISDLNSLTGLTELDLSGYRSSKMFSEFSGSGNTLTNAECLEEDEPLCSRLVERYNTQTNEASTNFVGASRYNKQASALKGRQMSHFAPRINGLIVPLPPNLKKLTVQFKQMSFAITEIEIYKNKLKVLDLSYNLLSLWHGPIEGVEDLESLDLSNNLATVIAPSFFSNFRSLKVLNISWNLLNNALVDDVEGKLFDQMSTLRVLDLSGNMLPKLPSNLFNGLSNLTTLVVSKNVLYSVKVRVKHMKNLKRINLSHNMLRWLSHSFMSDLDTIANAASHEVNLDLSYNPISCECANIHFLNWLLNSKIKQRHKMRYYYCFDAQRNNMSLLHLDRIVKSLSNSCTNTFGLTLGSTTIVLLFVFIVLAGVCYRYRWTFTYWYTRGRYDHRQINSDANYNFQYDAYVSFARENIDFYQNEMVPNTREKHLVSPNDTRATEREVRSRPDLIEQSKKTVLMLSKNFLKDKMCLADFTHAQNEQGVTGRDVLVMILLEDLSGEHVPGELQNQIREDSYLKYEERNKEQFWQRFNEAI